MKSRRTTRPNRGRRVIAALAAVTAGVLGASGAVSATSSHVAQAADAPVFGVYRGAPPGAPAKVTTFEGWAGHKAPVVLDFTASDSWESVSGPSWQLGPWRDSGRRLLYTLSLLPGPKDGSYNGGVSLEACAAGNYNWVWQKLGANLVAYGLEDTIVRPGHEFNGTWYAWAAKGKEAAYASCFRQLVTTMRATSGQQFAFMWSPNNGYGAFPAENAWPGDAYVDYIGLSAYDQSWAPNTYPYPSGATAEQIRQARVNAWNDIYAGNHGLAFWRDYSKAHGKKLALPEWALMIRPDGHGGGDNPYYIEQMYKFITDPNSNVAMGLYFDFNNEITHTISTAGTPLVQGAEAYRRLFGATLTTTSPTTSPSPSPSPTSTTTSTAPVATDVTTLRVSAYATRSPEAELNGRTLTGSVYVFAQPSVAVRAVRFYVDDPTMSGAPFKTELSAPYDMAGTGTSGANPWNVGALPAGTHRVTVAYDATDGRVLTATATFTVTTTATVSPSPSPTVSPSPTATVSPSPSPTSTTTKRKGRWAR